MRIIGLLGGTFDPVHNGHLRIAYELQQGLGLSQVVFIPCADPPHKAGTGASAEQRLAMLHLAVDGVAEFAVDDREFLRAGPSYTVDTLKEMKTEFGSDTHFVWIVGSDSFQTLDTWERWQEIFEYAHLLVACRPGWQQDKQSAMGRILEDRFTDDPIKLQQSSHGYILPWLVTQLSISATAIRDQYRNGHSPRFLIPDSVLDYVLKENIYR